jgi:hypothetical protein
MAKKKIQPRRVPRAAEPRMYGDGKPSTQASERTPGAATTSSATATRTTTATRPVAAAGRTTANPARTPVTTTQDYAYVLKDLRRLGVLAAGTFLLLIVLGLFIR